MSRISNNSFKVNAALEQIVEISNATAIPVSEEADITKWGGTATTLGQKAMAASVPVVIANDQAAIPISTASTLDVDLDSVSGAAITLGQKVMTTSLPVVLASDGAVTSGADDTLTNAQQVGLYGDNGTDWKRIQTSATGVLKTETEAATHAGSQGNLDNGSVVVGGDTSTSISTTNKTLLTVFGNHSSASAELVIQVSADGANFYPSGYSVYADSNGDFFQTLQACSNNIRLKYVTAGTVTASLLANAH